MRVGDEAGDVVVVVDDDGADALERDASGIARDARRPAIRDGVAGLASRRRRPDAAPGPADHVTRSSQAVNELPQPQPPVAFGFLNVKPEPCIDET